MSVRVCACMCLWGFVCLHEYVHMKCNVHVYEAMFKCEKKKKQGAELLRRWGNAPYFILCVSVLEFSVRLCVCVCKLATLMCTHVCMRVCRSVCVVEELIQRDRPSCWPVLQSTASSALKVFLYGFFSWRKSHIPWTSQRGKTQPESQPWQTVARTPAEK